jgi:hypothetical protein
LVGFYEMIQGGIPYTFMIIYANLFVNIKFRIF